MRHFWATLKYAVLALYIVVVVFPIAWMGLSSFKTTREIYQSPWSMPGELGERAYWLVLAAESIESNVSKTPGSFPTGRTEAQSASGLFAGLASDPIPDSPGFKDGGALFVARQRAPELRDTAKYITRSQNMARDLALYADALATDALEAARIKARNEDGYPRLREELLALAGQLRAKEGAGYFGNYTEAWTTTHIGSAFLNSLMVSFATMFVLIPISAMAAYVLAKYKFRGSNALFLLFLAGMMFPQFLVIVPLFLQMSGLGLDDSLSGLTLVYIAFSLPFTVFVLTGFFHQLPDELAEAALLDGCGHQAVFWKVMWPLAKPGLVVVTIFDAIGLWNEYNLALVLMRSREGFTLPRALDSLQMTAQYLGDTGALMAAMVIVVLPVLVVYWLLKDKIHEAMLAGAVKG